MHHNNMHYKLSLSHQFVCADVFLLMFDSETLRCCISETAKMKFLVACCCFLAGFVVLHLQVTPISGQATMPLMTVKKLQQFVDPLPDMPKVYGYSYLKGRPQSKTITIGMYQKQWKFHRDMPSTTVFAYGTSAENATVPGPTIEAYDGVPTYVTWENHLPDKHILPWDPTVPTAIPKTRGVPTCVHLHGGIHEPASDGSAFAWFTAGFQETGPAWTKRTYTYLNQRQLPGNLWYHDHALGLTRVNLLAGLIGAYVVRDPNKEGPFDAPSGPYDRHLLLFDRSFNVDGSFYMSPIGNNPSIHPQWQPEYFGDAIIVNGKGWPFMNVQRRRYRFRVINASNARYLNLFLSNGFTMTQLASDSTYLPRPVAVQSVLLSPAEVADVIIDFSASTPGEILLKNDAVYPYPTGIAPDATTGNVMKFVIQPGKPEKPDDSVIPKTTIPYPSPTVPVGAITRHIVMYEYDTPTGNPTHLYINGLRLEDPVTETPKAGSTEIWKVINLTPDNHPLHMHLALFQAAEQRELVDVNQFASCMATMNDAVKCNISSHAQGRLVPVPYNERTWKNVVKMAPGFMTTIIVKFGFVHANTTYPFDPTASPGYVYHCHILDHEDNAMIRPLKLVK